MTYDHRTSRDKLHEAPALLRDIAVELEPGIAQILKDIATDIEGVLKEHDY